jgi:carbonic anhydrase/acetyltransferase-like protein (isoleucine patch superfamily)
MVLGAPGKIVKTLEEEAVNFIRLSALSYVDNWRRFKSDLHVLDT